MTFVLFITYILYKISRNWTIGRDIFCSAEDYTNMSYYNCCGIRPKHSNISKRVGEEVITICAVLDQSTVILKKKGGYYNLCDIRSKSWQCYVLSVGSHPRRFS